MVAIESRTLLRAAIQLLSLQVLFIRHAFSVRPIVVQGNEFINSVSNDRFHIVGVALVPVCRERLRAGAIAANVPVLIATSPVDHPDMIPILETIPSVMVRFVCGMLLSCSV